MNGKRITSIFAHHFLMQLPQSYYPDIIVLLVFIEVGNSLHPLN